MASKNLQMEMVLEAAGNTRIQFGSAENLSLEVICIEVLGWRHGKCWAFWVRGKKKEQSAKD